MSQPLWQRSATEPAQLFRSREATPAARLHEAGAIVIGKTHVPGFTSQGYTSNAVFGVTRNPWNTDLTPGGSSGGAVASSSSSAAGADMCSIEQRGNDRMIVSAC